VLEGSEQREGGRVRITAEAGQGAGPDATLGRELRPGDVGHPGAAEQRRTQGRRVTRTQAAAGRAGAAGVGPLRQSDAYQAYLKGIHHLYRLTPGDFDTAQRYFEVALEKDPDYALAYTGIALVWAVPPAAGADAAARGRPEGQGGGPESDRARRHGREKPISRWVLGAWTDWDWVVAGAGVQARDRAEPELPGSPDQTTPTS